MKKLMHFLARLFPSSATGENPVAVNAFYRMGLVKAFFRRLKSRSGNSWPPYAGNYQLVNPRGQVAVCTLTSEHLFSKESLSENIAIIGTLITPNLGIERMILNLLANPSIRHLVICGKDSPIFKAGQALECLAEYGIDADQRIIHADGHFPVLRNLTKMDIDRFLDQVNLVFLKDVHHPGEILLKINGLKSSVERFGDSQKTLDRHFMEQHVVKLRAGGRREPLDYDKKGFFVIAVDHEKKEITLKHYHQNNSPGFLIKGRSAESILLAVLKQELVSQMSHAGYLGAELAKAETACRLNLVYVQDRPLRGAKR